MSEFPPVPDDGRILFFARDREAFGFLSHFYPAPLVIDGEAWLTAEHYYQAHKSLDPAYRRTIRACTTPGEAKQRAATPSPTHKRAKRSWFVTSGCEPRADWMDVKRDIMRRADREKYRQHPELAARLLATGDALIVEDTANDAFWGIGRDGGGENWAGRILMEVRDMLRSEVIA
jgi:ribA/ribD-fused uncharacterized protein